jgi:hypothetical protein
MERTFKSSQNPRNRIHHHKYKYGVDNREAYEFKTSIVFYRMLGQNYI